MKHFLYLKNSVLGTEEDTFLTYRMVLAVELDWGLCFMVMVIIITSYYKDKPLTYRAVLALGLLSQVTNQKNCSSEK